MKIKRGLANWENYLLANANDISELNQKVVEVNDKLVKDENGAGIWNDINLSVKNPLFLDLNYNRSSSMTTSIKRIRYLVLAYCNEYSKYYQDKALGNTIDTALLKFSALYNENTKNYGNWWDFEIGTPLILLDVLVLMRDELGINLIEGFITTIDKFVVNPSLATGGGMSTGANLLDRCLVKMLRHLLMGDLLEMKHIALKISPAFEEVVKSDGFYEDGGFIQHGSVPYISAYGRVLLYDAMKIAVLCEGLDIIDKHNRINQVSKLIFNNYLPFIYEGQTLFSTRGRSMARVETGIDDAALIIIASIKLCQEYGTEDDLKTIIEFAKYHIDLQKLDLTKLSNYDSQLLASCLNSSLEPKDIERRSCNYPSIASLNHVGSNYIVNLRMYSRKISATETGNGENKRGFMQGVGTVNHYSTVRRNYDSSYIATIDMFAYPGVTSDYQFTSHGGDWGLQTNKGLCSLNQNEKFQTAMLECNLENVTGSEMKINKSWTFDKDSYLTLASNLVNCEQAITTIFNELYDQNTIVYINGKQEKEFEGYVSTVLLERKGEANIGYAFTKPQLATFKINEKRGFLSDIHDYRGGSCVEMYATLQIENKPSEEYVHAYYTLFNITLDNLINYEPKLIVVESSSDAHLVYDTETETYFANIFRPYNGQLIQTQMPVSIIIEKTSSLKLYVADPSLEMNSVTFKILGMDVTVDTSLRDGVVQVFNI